MKRREFIAFLGGMAIIAPRAGIAETAKIYRLGTLTVGPPIPPTAGPGAISRRAGEARLRARRKPRVRTAWRRRQDRTDPKSDAGIESCQYRCGRDRRLPGRRGRQSSGVPTVIATGSGDPVVTGLVASLARPGGNVTGISDDAAALSTKRLGMLKAVAPKLHRVAMLWNKDDRGMSQRYDASAKAAEEIGVPVQLLGVREPDDFNEAFAAMDREPPDAILMVTDSLTLLIASAYLITPTPIACRRSMSRISWLARRPDIVRGGRARILRSRRRARRAYFPGRQARRPAVRAADALSVRDQHENRQSDEPRRSEHAACDG